MTHSYLIITDSGGIQEERPSLRKPILVFRKVTERSEGLETGGVKLVGQDGENVFREVSRLLEGPEQHQNMTAGYNPFGDGNAAQLLSTLWHTTLTEDLVSMISFLQEIDQNRL